MTTVDTALGPVAVAVRGKGPPVVLLHANPGDARDYNAVAPELAERFTTYAPDWPGFGRSPCPPDPRSATAMSYAALLPDLLDGLGVERAALIGNSMGGYAAARFALTQPDRVAALVLVNSSGFTPRHVLARPVARIKGMETVTRALVGRLPRLYLRRRTRVAREMIARDVRRRGNEATIQVEAAIWRSFNSPEHDLRASAARIGAPVMLAWGTRDPMLGWSAPAARRAMPKAVWRPFPTGHAPFAEVPGAFLAAVTPFLMVALSP